jgi:hypothetical protein
MNMKKNTLLWLLAYVGIGYGVYYLLSKKKRDANIIVNSGLINADLNWLLNREAGYLSAWAKAIRNNGIEFTYQGKTYLTKGGRVKK